MTDLRIQQDFNQPTLQVDVDRTRASALGFTQRDVANNLLISLSGSGQTAPTFWLNPVTGVSYSIATQITAVRDQLARGSGQHSAQWRAEAGSRRCWRGWRRCHAPSGWPWSRTTTCSSVDRRLWRGPGARSGRRRDGDRAGRRRRAQGSAARLADRPSRSDRDDAHVVPWPAGRPRAGHRAGLPADRRELPVVARSVHHHHGIAGGARRHRLDAVRDAHHVQRAVADRRHHVHGRCHREQHPGRELRQGAARRRRERRRPRRSTPASPASGRC